MKGVSILISSVIILLMFVPIVFSQCAPSCASSDGPNDFRFCEGVGQCLDVYPDICYDESSHLCLWAVSPVDVCCQTSARRWQPVYQFERICGEWELCTGIGCLCYAVKCNNCAQGKRYDVGKCADSQNEAECSGDCSDNYDLIATKYNNNNNYNDVNKPGEGYGNDQGCYVFNCASGYNDCGDYCAECCNDIQCPADGCFGSCTPSGGMDTCKWNDYYCSSAGLFGLLFVFGVFWLFL